jgi:hypothetical protein
MFVFIEIGRIFTRLHLLNEFTPPPEVRTLREKYRFYRDAHDGLGYEKEQRIFGAPRAAVYAGIVISMGFFFLYPPYIAAAASVIGASVAHFAIIVIYRRRGMISPSELRDIAKREGRILVGIPESLNSARAGEVRAAIEKAMGETCLIDSYKGPDAFADAMQASGTCGIYLDDSVINSAEHNRASLFTVLLSGAAGAIDRGKMEAVLLKAI